jgi:pyrroloquinoline-quinone synthase
LDSILARWDLLSHPFYQSWSAGTLPVVCLKTYAREYGALVAALPAGWEAVGDSETVAEEREHAELWDAFAAALGTSVEAPQIAQTKTMSASLNHLFSQPATALGALYAFEAQQPATAASKLEGLRSHYDLTASAEVYFETHAGEEHEVEKLLGMMASLPHADLDKAVEACETMAEVLWDTLTGVMESAT